MKKAVNVDRYSMYMLATIPFAAMFAYQVLVVLPRRPEKADIVHGYTIPFSLDDGPTAHYLSTLDCIQTSIPFFCCVMLCAIGMWRAGAFAREK